MHVIDRFKLVRSILTRAMSELIVSQTGETNWMKLIQLNK